MSGIKYESSGNKKSSMNPWILVAVTLMSIGLGAALMYSMYSPDITHAPSEWGNPGMASYLIDSVVDNVSVSWYRCYNYSSERTVEVLTNRTQVTQNALNNLTVSGGKLFLKECAFNYSLSIPANVSVVESLNGVERKFGNIADSQGSPYTISVDTVYPTYYLGQDSADTIVNSWSSTNASSVINNALGNTTGGGTVFLRAGIYALTSPIQMQNYVNLQGESQVGTVLNSSVAGMWIINTTGAYMQYNTISSLCLVCNGVSNGMNLTDTHYLTVRDVYIYNAGQYGIYHDGGESPLLDNIVITMAAAAPSGSYGLSVVNTNDVLIRHVFVVPLAVTDNVVNIFVYSCYGLVLQGFEGGNAYIDLKLGAVYAADISGLEVEGSCFGIDTTSGWLNASSIHNNYITGRGTTNSSWIGIYLGYAESVTIERNYIKNERINVGFGVGVIHNLKITDDYYVNVAYVYLTENNGVAVNATATTWTITHRLAGTPTGVWCSFNSTQVDSWIWTSTSSTITVTCTNSATTDAIVTCYWKAEWIT